MKINALYESILFLNPTDSSYKDDLRILIEAYDKHWSDKDAVRRQEVSEIASKQLGCTRMVEEANDRANKATRTTERMVKIMHKFMEGRY